MRVEGAFTIRRDSASHDAESRFKNTGILMHTSGSPAPSDIGPSPPSSEMDASRFDPAKRDREPRPALMGTSVTMSTIRASRQTDVRCMVRHHLPPVRPIEIGPSFPLNHHCSSGTIMSAKSAARNFVKASDAAPEAFAEGTPTAPVVVPVAGVHAGPAKLEVNTVRRYDAQGRLTHVRMTARPGFKIETIILTGFDPQTKTCRVGLTTVPWRGRPRRSQRDGE
jgi:hypothetical protein